MSSLGLALKSESSSGPFEALAIENSSSVLKLDIWKFEYNKIEEDKEGVLGVICSTQTFIHSACLQIHQFAHKVQIQMLYAHSHPPL